MSIYKVTDKISGLTLKLTGSNPPTEEELEGIFQEMKQSDGNDRDLGSSADSGKKEGETNMAGKNAVIGNTKAVPFLLGGAVGAGMMLLVASKSRKPRPGPVKRLAAGARDQVAATFGKVKSAVKKG
jgi:hypothetical protein